MNIDPVLPSVLALPLIATAPAVTETPAAVFSLVLASAPGGAPASLQPQRVVPDTAMAVSHPMATTPSAPAPPAFPQRRTAQVPLETAPLQYQETRVVREPPIMPSGAMTVIAVGNKIPRRIPDAVSVGTTAPLGTVAPRAIAATEAELPDEILPVPALEMLVSMPPVLPDLMSPQPATPVAGHLHVAPPALPVRGDGTAVEMPPAARDSAAGPVLIRREPAAFHPVSKVAVPPLRQQGGAGEPDSLPLQMDVDAEPTPAAEIRRHMVPSASDRAPERLADSLAMSGTVSSILAPSGPAKPAVAQGAAIAAAPPPVAGTVPGHRRTRIPTPDGLDAPAPWAPTLADSTPRMLHDRGVAASPTLLRERHAAVPVAADASTELAVATDRFGDVRIAIEGTATDVKVAMALAPTAVLAPTDAQRLANGLAADLAASGVRLQSLDISGGDTARGGTPQGQREPPPPRAQPVPFAPLRAPAAPRSDRYA